jgi:hypothetical protein
MTAKSYSALAAMVFTVVAALQLVRAVEGFNVAVGAVQIPIAASWVAFVVAGVLALLGFMAALR